MKAYTTEELVDEHFDNDLFKKFMDQIPTGTPLLTVIVTLCVALGYAIGVDQDGDKPQLNELEQMLETSQVLINSSARGTWQAPSQSMQ